MQFEAEVLKEAKRQNVALSVLEFRDITRYARYLYRYAGLTEDEIRTDIRSSVDVLRLYPELRK